MLWGLSWTFASGSDVAWVTDELARPDIIASVLVRAGRVQLAGSAAGTLAFGLLASLTGRGTAMVLAGAAMLLLGGYVVLRFRETRFVPTATNRWAATWSVLVRGTALVRRSRTILLVMSAAFLVNGASDTFARLYPRRLFDIGLPSQPLWWFTALSLVALLVGALALRSVESRMDNAVTARRGYALACAAGVVGLAGLAVAPEDLSGGAAVLLVAGIALPLTRTIGTILVNQQTTGDVRATVHSYLAQAEYAGEIICSFAVALVAGPPVCRGPCAAARPCSPSRSWRSSASARPGRRRRHVPDGSSRGVGGTPPRRCRRPGDRKGPGPGSRCVSATVRRGGPRSAGTLDGRRRAGGSLPA